MDGWVDGYINRIDGWMYGWVNEWIVERWMDDLMNMQTIKAKDTEGGVKECSLMIDCHFACKRP